MATEAKYRSEYSGQELDEYITRFKDVTATSSELNVLDGISITVADLNRLAGLAGLPEDMNLAEKLKILEDLDTSSSIKTQLDAKKDKVDFISKGSQSVPIYFDANGAAQEVTQFEGKAASAECATCDKDGNEITTTYLKNTHKNRVESTLYASKWSGNKYSFEDVYVSTDYAISIELSPEAGVDQLKAFGKAGLAGNISKNIITAIKKVPTIDIPIIINIEKLV